MLLLDAPLTFGEFMTGEELPLAVVFREVLGFLRQRPDATLFGAHAVNAYCEPARMTQDVDVLSLDAPAFAEAMRAHLAGRFHIAVRVREVVPGQGYRVYQLRKPQNRHLVDVRQITTLPPRAEIEGVQVVVPEELIAMKVVSYATRANQPKGATDLADLRRLLLRFPELKVATGAVSVRLTAMEAPPEGVARWRELVASEILEDPDDGW